MCSFVLIKFKMYTHIFNNINPIFHYITVKRRKQCVWYSPLLKGFGILIFIHIRFETYYDWEYKSQIKHPNTFVIFQKYFKSLNVITD